MEAEEGTGILSLSHSFFFFFFFIPNIIKIGHADTWGGGGREAASAMALALSTRTGWDEHTAIGTRLFKAMPTLTLIIGDDHTHCLP